MLRITILGRLYQIPDNFKSDVSIALSIPLTCLLATFSTLDQCCVLSVRHRNNHTKLKRVVAWLEYIIEFDTNSVNQIATECAVWHLDDVGTCQNHTQFCISAKGTVLHLVFETKESTRRTNLMTRLLVNFGAYVDQDLGRALQRNCLADMLLGEIQRDFVASGSQLFDEHDRTCKRCTPTVDALPLSLQPRSRSPQEPWRTML